MRVFHEPVLLSEILEIVKSVNPGIFVDCTIGDGGHALGILSTLEKVVLVGLDIDGEAIEVSRKRVWTQYKGRCLVEEGDYRNLPSVLGGLGVPRVDGFLFDLGVSSRQIDESWRGFTYKQDAPLDMRMNPQAPRSAKDILNESSREHLAWIIREYGEERFALRIAEEIVKRRVKEPFETSKQLVETVVEALPGKAKKGAMHSIKRTFQAIRIAVNDELSRLGMSLGKGFALLREGGIICVISYHSLEDRIVKNTFQELETRGAVRLTKKVIKPSPEEIAKNPRAKSAKLRVIGKIGRCDGNDQTPDC